MNFTLAECIALPEHEGGFHVTEQIVNGRTVRVPTLGRQLAAFFVDDTTPVTWIEPDGSAWMLGRYADGEWCKRRT